MPHIHTKPNQYDLTVGAYIIRLDTAEPSIILHRHKKLNKYLQFGGHVELDENPWSAVTHEVSEESGYAMNQLKLLQPNVQAAATSAGVVHPLPVATLSVRYGDTAHFHTDIAYAFVTHELPSGTLHDGESNEIKTFTAAGLTALPTDEIPENVREIALYTLQECLTNWVEVDCANFRTSNPT